MVRYEHFAFRLKLSFSPVVKTTSDGKQSVLTLKFTFENFKVLLGIHIFNSVAYYFKMNDHPFLLYQACMRPYSFYDTPLLYTLKLDSALLFIYNFIIIIGNVYLFLFLQSKTENNTALNSVDKKKERKRNFVSAKSGIICGFVLAISTFVYSIFYGLKVHYII